MSKNTRMQVHLRVADEFKAEETPEVRAWLDEWEKRIQKELERATHDLHAFGIHYVVDDRHESDE